MLFDLSLQRMRMQMTMDEDGTEQCECCSGKWRGCSVGQVARASLPLVVQKQTVDLINRALAPLFPPFFILWCTTSHLFPPHPRMLVVSLPAKLNPTLSSLYTLLLASTPPSIFHPSESPPVPVSHTVLCVTQSQD